VTAVDTNALVRVITWDDKAQAERAVAFLEAQDRVFVTKTVLLEVEWVLRSGYRYSAQQILSAVRALLNMKNVEVEDEVAVAHAMNWYEQGMDFADSFHVASAGTYRFATFDVALQRRARHAGIDKIALL
jgi:predicted nucleic-acid-binding protein